MKNKEMQQACIALPHNKKSGEIVVATFHCDKSELDLASNNSAYPFSPFSGENMRKLQVNSSVVKIEDVRRDLAQVGQCSTCDHDMYTLKATAAALDEVEGGSQLYCVLCNTPFDIHVDPKAIKNVVTAAETEDSEADAGDSDPEDSTSETTASSSDSDSSDLSSDDSDSDAGDSDASDAGSDSDESSADSDSDSDSDSDDSDVGDDEFDPRTVEASAEIADVTDVPEVTDVAEVAKPTNEEIIPETTTVETMTPEVIKTPEVVTAAVLTDIKINFLAGGPKMTRSNTVVAALSSDEAMVFINKLPVYVLKASRATEEVRPYFNDVARLSHLIASVIDGLKDNETIDLRNLGAEPFEITVPVDQEIENRVQASVAQATTNLNTAKNELSQDFKQCLSMAASIMIKNTDSELVNPVQTVLVASLKRLGVNSADTIVDSAFEKGGEDFVRLLITKACELVEKPAATRDDLARFIKNAPYKTTARAENDIINDLKSGNAPFATNFNALASVEPPDGASEVDAIRSIIRLR